MEKTCCDTLAFMPGDPHKPWPKMGGNPRWVLSLSLELAEYHARHGSITGEQWDAYRAIWCNTGHVPTCPQSEPRAIGTAYHGGPRGPTHWPNSLSPWEIREVAGLPIACFGQDADPWA